MKYYFAYGSNLHHFQMKRRCPNCRFIKKMVLKNYNLTFRSKYGAADIEKKTGKKVHGALYVISRAAEKRLDLNDLIKRAKTEAKNDKKFNLLIFSGAASVVVVFFILLSL